MKFNIKSAVCRIGLACAIALCVLCLSSCGDDGEDGPVVPENEKMSQTFMGETRTWPEASPADIYVGQRPSAYTVTVDPETKVATLVISDADFLAGMPALGDMTFPGIKYTVTDNVVKLTCDALIPLIGERPFSGFPISNFQARWVPDRTLDLQFICNYRGTPYVVYFRGTKVDAKP